MREHAELARELSRVARRGDEVVGCCRIWRIRVGGAPATFLGPLAVSPSAQGEGIGAALIAGALEACDDAGLPVLVVGRPELFGPFGFVQVEPGAIRLPGPIEARRFQIRGPRGAPCALQGAVTGLRAAS